jgi:hypothetical protein
MVVRSEELSRNGFLSPLPWGGVRAGAVAA